MKHGKVKRCEKIGYVMSLSTEQHFSSGSFLDVHNIIFEEFMERGGAYLPKEPERLLIFYNTIDKTVDSFEECGIPIDYTKEELIDGFKITIFIKKRRNAS